MKHLFWPSLFAATVLMIAISFGCSKERIVESTQYIHDTKYIDLPPDTVLRIDTVFRQDSSLVYRTDTIRVHDTVTIRDTVVKSVYAPSAATAISAMEVQTDPLIFAYALQNFGDSAGWTTYLSPTQMAGQEVSTGVFDLYAYVMYWTGDFSGYYPFEIYWRMTYKSGDPSDAANWTMTDPPAATPGKIAGLSASLSAFPAMHAVPGKLIAVPRN